MIKILLIVCIGKQLSTELWVRVELVAITSSDHPRPGGGGAAGAQSAGVPPSQQQYQLPVWPPPVIIGTSLQTEQITPSFSHQSLQGQPETRLRILQYFPMILNSVAPLDISCGVTYF